MVIKMFISVIIVVRLNNVIMVTRVDIISYQGH